MVEKGMLIPETSIIMQPNLLDAVVRMYQAAKNIALKFTEDERGCVIQYFIDDDFVSDRGSRYVELQDPLFNDCGSPTCLASASYPKNHGVENPEYAVVAPPIKRSDLPGFWN